MSNYNLMTLVKEGIVEMEISIDFNNIITEQETTVLLGVLGCQNEKELQVSLSKICEASICEYLEMILGKQLPTRGDEIRERRLYHLVKHYFINKLPTESEISSMFQLTNTGSRSLLRNVRTKFRFNLEYEINNTVSSILSSARIQRDESYNVIIQSDNILEELKRVADIEAIELQPIVKVKNSNGVYNIPPDTYNVLCEHYQATAEVAAGGGDRH